MKKSTLILFFACLCAWSLRAETIVLKSGKTISGQILVQTSEVVIIKDVSGARFQYPTSEIARISNDVAPAADSASEDLQAALTTATPSGKKAQLMFELAAGGLSIGTDQTGAYVAADLLIGSKRLLAAPIMLGGSVGYMGALMGNKNTYNYLPICLATRIPLMEGKHTPLLGASIGYGVGLSKLYQGGLHAGVDVAYRCTLNERAAIALGFNVRFQQSMLHTTETFEESQYTNQAGRSLVAYGLKLGFTF